MVWPILISVSVTPGGYLLSAAAYSAASAAIVRAIGTAPSAATVCKKFLRCCIRLLSPTMLDGSSSIPSFFSSHFNAVE
jgi:hypothetical protein